MRISKFALITFLMILKAPITFANEKDWVKKGFQISDARYKYFVGVSAPIGNKQDAIEQSKTNAIILMVNQEFSTGANVTVKTAEDTNAVAVARTTFISVSDVDLTDFELVDQEVETIDGDVPTYVTHSLFRFDKNKLDQQRQRLLSKGKDAASLKEGNSDIEKKLALALEEKKKRDEEFKRINEVWKSVFPAVGLDAAVGYGGVKSADFLTFGLGLRFRVLDRFYLGGFYTYGSGSERKPDSGNSNNGGNQDPNQTTSKDKDVFIKTGIDVRLYLVRDVRSGFYIKGLWGQDQLHLTCPKDAAGNCSSAMPKNQTGYAFGGGIGFQKNIGDFYYWIEGVAGNNSNPEIGTNVSINLGITWGVVK